MRVVAARGERESLYAGRTARSCAGTAPRTTDTTGACFGRRPPAPDATVATANGSTRTGPRSPYENVRVPAGAYIFN
ncbi:hypothetical protein [Phytohabitans kaempferiae]|uniref:Uncharacterized protein n=1 Tax=Phytohabitans kaempferiae TaxID=1620943 RepID=A0ABV6MBM9_9ACTN